MKPCCIQTYCTLCHKTKVGKYICSCHDSRIQSILKEAQEKINNLPNEKDN